MPYVLASRPGSLPDGNRYLVLVAVPFDDVSARMAEALDVELAMRPSILLRARAQDPWDGLPDRPAADDESPEGVGDPVAAVSDALGEPLLDDRGHHAAEDLHAEEDDTSGAASLSLRLGLSDGGGGVPASTLLDVTVMDLASGQPLGTDAGGLPLVQLDFSAVDFIRDRAAGGRMEGILWQGIQILTITLGVMVLVAIAIGVGLTASVTRAVSALHRGTERIRGGALDHRINVRSRDQLGALADSFNQMTDSVAGLLREKADHERLEHEMAIAAEVQKHMLPEGFPTIPGLEGAARCVMAKQVGGDLYDFIPVGTNRLAILLGDVSGKGVSAALVMSNVVSAARSLLSGSDTPGPAALLTRLNRILHRTTSAETFVTLFYAEYDLRTGNLRYANAGHDWPFILSPEGEVLMELEASGLMLGALGDTVLEEREVVLAPGQVLVAYSDGLVDTINQDDEPFGVHRVRDAIRVHLEEPVGQMVDALVSRLQEFRGDAEEVDDVTMVVVRRVTRPGDVDPDRAGDPVPEEATA
jgi:serine phosphatase RsbU (regulator of sigma subunit)